VAWLPKLLVEREIQENKLKVLDGKQYYLFQDVYLVKREMSFSNRINYIWNILIQKNK
jgi:hypothetical protein